ncbi:type II toxin-antitoxin system RelE/ParE family toxin [Oceanibaculum indicum]|uniref:Plasmid stabilization system n=1 Tax=Oceanibaculum indicum P24 TaxID=1207063 RepID=K2IZY8_9PROT|nr:type II toxin-antitoxin system RelE/ParE family toxin [Oceanibaculum indicum]EKE68468.1 plasmid stabilization system [Oceanibaculum indicum P24]
MAAYNLSQLAEDDIRRLYRYGIEKYGLAHADRYFDGLFARFDAIAESPALYPRVDHIRPGYRRSVYGVHSIYYRETDSGAEIMRVLSRENPSDLEEA